MPPPTDPERAPSGRDAARRALEAVLRDQQERRDRRAPPPEPRRTPRGPLIVALLALTALTVAVWVSPPAWARPDPLPRPSPRHLEAGLRVDVWVAVQRIRRFQEERGRLPVMLGEAVPPAADPGDLVYERVSSEAFRLVGSREDGEVVYESTDPVEELVEEARSVIGGGLEP